MLIVQVQHLVQLVLVIATQETAKTRVVVVYLVIMKLELQNALNVPQNVKLVKLAQQNVPLVQHKTDSWLRELLVSANQDISKLLSLMALQLANLVPLIVLNVLIKQITVSHASLLELEVLIINVFVNLDT